MKTTAITTNEVTSAQAASTRATNELGLAEMEFSSVVNREVNMGFTENPFYDEASGFKSEACQRISFCSCDCNHCCKIFY